MRHAESTKQKEKILTGNFYSPKSGSAFYGDFLTPLGKKAKKWRLEFLSSPTILKGILNLKTQNFAVKLNCKNRFTFI